MVLWQAIDNPSPFAKKEVGRQLRKYLYYSEGREHSVVQERCCPPLRMLRESLFGSTLGQFVAVAYEFLSALFLALVCTLGSRVGARL